MIFKENTYQSFVIQLFQPNIILHFPDAQNFPFRKRCFTKQTFGKLTGIHTRK